MPMVRCFRVLIIFVLVFTSYVEVGEADHLNSNHEHSTYEISSVKDVSPSLLKSSPCKDCEEEGCSDSGDCCQRLCACTVTFFVESRSHISSLISSLSSKIDWYFYNNYRSPFLDPSLKPPLFS